MVEVRSTSRSNAEGEQRCPLCRDTLATSREPCQACQTSYHSDCLVELGGCSTLGCRLRGQLPEAFDTWFCRACHQPIERDLTRRRCPCGAYLHDVCIEAHRQAGCTRTIELWRGPQGSRSHVEERWRLPAPPRSVPALTGDDRGDVSRWRVAATDEDPLPSRLGLAMLWLATGLGLAGVSKASVSDDAGLVMLLMLVVSGVVSLVLVQRTRRLTSVEATHEGLRFVTHAYGWRLSTQATPSDASSAEGAPVLLSNPPLFRLRVGQFEFVLPVDGFEGRWIVQELRAWGNRQQR